MCWDSASYSGEGACHDMNIDEVFPGCVRVEAFHYARIWGEMTGE